MKPKHDQKAEHKAREAAMRTMVLRTTEAARNANLWRRSSRRPRR